MLDFAAGIGIGIAIGFLFTCCCLCCFYSRCLVFEPWIAVLTDILNYRRAKTYEGKIYGRHEEKDLDYVRQFKSKPFVRYQPETQLSRKFMGQEESFHLLFYEEQFHNLEHPEDFIPSNRGREEKYTNMVEQLVPPGTVFEKEEICGVDCVWVTYPGCSKDNGVIVYYHGGGYIGGIADHYVHFLAYLGKWTGCVGLSVDYERCPEREPEFAISDGINVQKYIAENLDIPFERQIVAGESAGVGYVLLCLHKLAQQGIRPACGWMISGWSNIACDTESYDRLNGVDSVLYTPLLKQTGEFVVQNRDVEGKETGKGADILGSPYAPVTGDYAGFCPLYWTVGGTEVCLDDSINECEKAYNAGVNAIVDILPHGFHGFALQLRADESKMAVGRACQFILDALSARQD